MSYTKNKKIKKYSLADRIVYYSKIQDKYFKKAKQSDGSFDYSVMKDNNFQHASGYLQTVEGGRPLNFKERSKSYQKGCLSAEKAKEKLNHIKF